MTRANMVTITGKAWTDADATAWLMPYGKAPDPALAARCKTLGELPDGQLRPCVLYALYQQQV